MPLNTAYLNKRLSAFRSALSQVEALPQLSFIALIIGACTGLLIVLFRLALETPALLFDIGNAENFEALSPSARVGLILAGTTIIGLTLHTLTKSQRQMSVAHVLDRLHNHQGKMPISNWLAQLVLAIVAVVSGQSVGREGPAVHIGAGASSILGRWLRLPNNSMQTIIACGVAAGISASFDTPLAGVIFAMEVIVMEYSIVGFVPVILASVIGAAITKSLLGDELAFNVSSIALNSLYELGFIVAMGFVIAILAGSYIKLNLFALRFNKHPIMLRVMIAGALTALVALYIPEVMGLGYDTIQQAINGQLLFGTLLLIAFAKLVLTPIVIGLGIPGGLIGPSLFIGACAGGVWAYLLVMLFPESSYNPTLYILLGMTGMMAAVINAPLAALVAILELSHNPNLIFPAMLMIVVACINTRHLFNVRGIFLEQLYQSGKDIAAGPATKALRKAGVLSIVDRNFVLTDEHINYQGATYCLNTKPNWLVYAHDERLYALHGPDFAHFLQNLPEYNDTNTKDVYLHEIPGLRHMLHPVLESDSLFDAATIIRKSQCEILYVTSNPRSLRSVHGLVTLDAIKDYYQPKEITDALG